MVGGGDLNDDDEQQQPRLGRQAAQRLQGENSEVVPQRARAVTPRNLFRPEPPLAKSIPLSRVRFSAPRRLT